MTQAESPIKSSTAARTLRTEYCTTIAAPQIAKASPYERRLPMGVSELLFGGELNDTIWCATAINQRQSSAPTAISAMLPKLELMAAIAVSGRTITADTSSRLKSSAGIQCAGAKPALASRMHCISRNGRYRYAATNSILAASNFFHRSAES